MTTKRTVQMQRLGQTDIEITPIGLGTMQFSGSQGIIGKIYFPQLSQEEMNGIIKVALDGGINWFDTAELYGRGRSERGLATALKAAGMQDDDVLVATKWFPILRRAGSIPRTIDDRLRFLDGYTIDLYMVHQPWGFSSPEAEMDAMADLVEAGKIRSIRVSNFTANQMQRAHAALQKRGLPLAVNQVQYSLLYRNIETNGVLSAARDLGITIVAWSPLASGLLTGEFHDNPERIRQTPFVRRTMIRRKIDQSRPLVTALREIGARYSASPGQIALSWLIRFQGELVVAIPGASKARHAEQNAGAMTHKLSVEEMARLDELSREFRR